ncbi:Hypothetical predicted protein, partial [Cloeon dipterum]
ILTRLAEPRDEGDFQCPHHRQRQASAGRRPRHRTETIDDEVTSDNWIDELCLKDNLLADQRKIIVEIQIKLDEKQKEMEELRQSLDTQHSVVDWLEAEKQQRLLEADEKLEKSVKAVQTLHDETEHVWRELDETRRQVEQLSRENVALEVCLTLARLDELAAFLAALLRRPHLLASFSATNRSWVEQLPRRLRLGRLRRPRRLAPRPNPQVPRNTSFTSFWMITCSVLLCSCECRLRGQRPPGVDRWPRLHFG